jgi:hypothetical protein
VTLNELATDVKSRLNLTSSEADTRIRANLNAAYRKVTSGLGLQTARRATDTQATVADTPQVTFDLEKIERVYVIDGGRQRVLDELIYDLVKEANVSLQTTGLPLCYAVENMGAASVTIILDPIPGDVFTIKADGTQNASTLADNDSPAFPADFHDVLTYDALRIEWLKLEKPALAKQAEADYQQRLSDLRFFIAKSHFSVIPGQRSRWGRRQTSYRIV